MDRERFEYLVDAYGADFRRWPENERAAAEAYAVQSAEASAALQAARALDAVLDHARPVSDTSALAARILAAAPRAERPFFNRRAMIALAACAVFGVLLGYGGGRFAPVADDDDGYFATAFEPPFDEAFGDEG